jgi:hypothetical protein
MVSTTSTSWVELKTIGQDRAMNAARANPSAATAPQPAVGWARPWPSLPPTSLVLDVPTDCRG